MEQGANALNFQVIIQGDNKIFFLMVTGLSNNSIEMVCLRQIAWDDFSNLLKNRGERERYKNLSSCPWVENMVLKKGVPKLSMTVVAGCSAVYVSLPR